MSRHVLCFSEGTHCSEQVNKSTSVITSAAPCSENIWTRQQSEAKDSQPKQKHKVLVGRNKGAEESRKH